MTERNLPISFAALAFFTLVFCLAPAKTLKEVKPAYHRGRGFPSLAQMTKITSDPSRDQEKDHLDIVADYFAFSDTKFFSAIRNRGGGFPTSARLGSVYFSYMAIIANPADDDVVWAMTYMKVPLAGFKPGLYRIGGMDSKDLVRIGDIDYKIDPRSNLLMMSCEISSLLSDPLFAAWYKPGNPFFGLASMISKTTVIPYGTSTQDTTYPGVRVIPIITD